jgi:hypothetical protein
MGGTQPVADEGSSRDPIDIMFFYFFIKISTLQKMGADQSKSTSPAAHVHPTPHYARGYSVRPPMGTHGPVQSSVVTHGQLYQHMRLLDTRPAAFPGSDHAFIRHNRPGIPDITPGAYHGRMYDLHGDYDAWALT